MSGRLNRKPLMQCWNGVSDMKYLGAITALGADRPAYINFSRDGEEVLLVGRTSAAEGSKDFSVAIPCPLFELLLGSLNTNYRLHKKD